MLQIRAETEKQFDSIVSLLTLEANLISRHSFSQIFGNIDALREDVASQIPPGLLLPAPATGLVTFALKGEPYGFRLAKKAGGGPTVTDRNTDGRTHVVLTRRFFRVSDPNSQTRFRESYRTIV